MFKPAYHITDWDSVFEKSQSKRAKNHHWVAMPLKHDGSGFRRITIQPNATDLFCAWCLIVQVAAKCKVRGVLADSNGTPLDSEDLAIKTGFPVAIFDTAFEFFSSEKIGWLARSKTKNTRSALGAKPKTLRAHSERTRSKQEKSASENTHSTVQDNTIQNTTSTHTRNHEDDLLKKYPEYALIAECEALKSITIEQYAKIRQSFPRLYKLSRIIELLCLKANNPDTKIKSPYSWLVSTLQKEPDQERPPEIIKADWSWEDKKI